MKKPGQERESESESERERERESTSSPFHSEAAPHRNKNFFFF
jgi:hypothetical protein